MGKKGIVENELSEEAKKEIVELSVANNSTSMIASKINEKYNANLSSQNIQKYLQRARKKVFNYVSSDENYQRKIAETYFNSTTQLKQANSVLWELILDMKKDRTKIISCPKCGTQIRIRDTANLIKSLSELLSQIKHVDRVLGKTSDAPLKVEYNFVDLSKKLQVMMPEMLEKMKNQGIIKGYNKKRFRQFN